MYNKRNMDSKNMYVHFYLKNLTMVVGFIKNSSWAINLAKERKIIIKNCSITVQISLVGEMHIRVYNLIIFNVEHCYIGPTEYNER